MQAIRVIDGGGNGFRRADIFGKEIRNLKTTRRGQINTPRKLLEFACANLPKDCAGVSYAIAGEVKDCTVVKSPQIPWLNGYCLGIETICELRERKLPERTALHNDMDGAVMGMAQLLPNAKYFMGITWSSGIGLRVFKNGEIIAPCEGGHISLDPSPFAPLCGCGKRGCVESICGGESIRRRVLAETEILGIEIPKMVHPCRFLDDCFQKDHDWAYDIYSNVASGMGIFLATIQTLFRLPLVVWKGKFAFNALPLIGELMRRCMKARLINPLWEIEMQFIPSPEPEKDSLIGAAALFRQEYK